MSSRPSWRSPPTPSRARASRRPRSLTIRIVSKKYADRAPCSSTDAPAWPVQRLSTTSNSRSSWSLSPSFQWCAIWLRIAAFCSKISKQSKPGFRSTDRTISAPVRVSVHRSRNRPIRSLAVFHAAAAWKPARSSTRTRALLALPLSRKYACSTHIRRARNSSANVWRP